MVLRLGRSWMPFLGGSSRRLGPAPARISSRSLAMILITGYTHLREEVRRD